MGLAEWIIGDSCLIFSDAYEVNDMIIIFLLDGTEISPDVIILATGYQYNLPHLSDIGITETGPMTLYPFNAYKVKK